MPLPTPNDGESQDHWISRCMANPTMNREYEDAEQRLAVCYSQWRNKMSDKMKRVILNGLKFIGEQGEFRAVFATLNVVDADGDLTLPGAFGKQDVILSQYNHGSWGSGVSALPIGIGKIFEEGEEAIIEGEFNLESEDALKTYQTLKYLYVKKRTQEWSYALPEIDYEIREEDGQRIRVLKRIRVNEVSPVLMGSGVDTRLLNIKGTFTDSDKDELGKLAKRLGCTFVLVDEEGKPLERASRAKYTEPITLVEHLEVVQADAERLVDRVKKLGDMRDEKNRHLAEDTMRRAAQIKAVFIELVHELDELQKRHQAMYKEFLRFQKIIAERREKDGA